MFSTRPTMILEKYEHPKNFLMFTSLNFVLLKIKNVRLKYDDESDKNAENTIHVDFVEIIDPKGHSYK